jgi:ABC-type transporter Mla subunit MlaD
MALEVELEVLKTVVTKLDSSLEKISEVSNSIGRLLAVHDERIDQLEKSSDKRSDEIKELHSRITTQTREILEKITSLEKNMEDRMRDNANSTKLQHQDIQKEIKQDIIKLDDRIGIIERWRWYLMGGAATIGFAAGNMLDWIKFLK